VYKLLIVMAPAQSDLQFLMPMAELPPAIVEQLEIDDNHDHDDTQASSSIKNWLITILKILFEIIVELA
jgi:hypothetical protein